MIIPGLRLRKVQVFQYRDAAGKEHAVHGQVRRVFRVHRHRVGSHENGSPVAEPQRRERGKKGSPPRAKEDAMSPEAPARQRICSDLAAAGKVHDAGGPEERVEREPADRLAVGDHVRRSVHVRADVRAHREAGGLEERAVDQARRRAPAERDVARPDGGLLVDPLGDVQDRQRILRTVFVSAYRSATCGSYPRWRGLVSMSRYSASHR